MRPTRASTPDPDRGHDGRGRRPDLRRQREGNHSRGAGGADGLRAVRGDRAGAPRHHRARRPFQGTDLTPIRPVLRNAG
ncbi:hypothetical protein MICRO11B_770013 [Micrococcus luteus]|nr:hypothetical protein MICRO11B_770013 [Micrococcus luteus]